MRVIDPVERCSRKARSSTPVERPGHRRLDGRHVAHDHHVAAVGSGPRPAGPQQLVAGVARTRAGHRPSDSPPSGVNVGVVPPATPDLGRHLRPAACPRARRSRPRSSGRRARRRGPTPAASAVWRARASGLEHTAVTGPSHHGGQRPGLATAGLGQRGVGPPQQQPGRVRRRLAVADEDQHVESRRTRTRIRPHWSQVTTVVGRQVADPVHLDRRQLEVAPVAAIADQARRADPLEAGTEPLVAVGQIGGQLRRVSAALRGLRQLGRRSRPRPRSPPPAIVPPRG